MSKTVELTLPPGLTATLTLRPLPSGTAVTASLVEQIAPTVASNAATVGRYLASVDSAAAGAHWYSAAVGTDVLDAGYITIAASGVSRPTGGEGTVSGFSAAALAQLAAAEIEITTNPPIAGAITIVRGCDHLVSDGNGFTWRNAAGTWPDLDARSISLEIVSGRTAIGIGFVNVASGPNQEVACSMTAEQSDLLTPGRGRFLVVATDGDGDRYPLALGVANVV